MTHWLDYSLPRPPLFGPAEHEKLQEAIFEACCRYQTRRPGNTVMHRLRFGQIVIQGDTKNQDNETREPISFKRDSVSCGGIGKRQVSVQMMLTKNTDDKGNCPTGRGTRLNSIEEEDNLIGHIGSDGAYRSHDSNSEHFVLTAYPGNHPLHGAPDSAMDFAGLVDATDNSVRIAVSAFR